MYHIAAQKKRENIAEYLIFMWQMEDLLRGVDFDTDALARTVLETVEDEETRAETLQWFQWLAGELKASGATLSGHHSESDEILAELQLLQHTLLTLLHDEDFRKAYNLAQPLLEEFRQKTDKVPRSDPEAALTALYGYLTLRLAGKEISPETAEAMQVISAYLSRLASAYRDMRLGHLPMNN